MELKFRVWVMEKNRMFYPEGEYEILLTKSGVFTESKKFVVMQFTGLKDKNGKEIYEGDIVRTQYKKKDRWSEEPVYITDIRAIKWDDNTAGFRAYKGKQGGVITGKQHEIIGNVIENPELFDIKQLYQEV
jgi:uncharacterized phage protein (TIGR01671 family)